GKVAEGLEAAEAGRARALADLLRQRQLTGASGSLLTAQSPTSGEIILTAQRLGATVVEYLITDEGSFAWVVQPEGTVRLAPIGARRERLESLTRTVRSTIESRPRTAATTK